MTQATFLCHLAWSFQIIWHHMSPIYAWVCQIWELAQLLVMGLIWVILQWPRTLSMMMILLTSNCIYHRRKWEHLDRTWKKYSSIWKQPWNKFLLHCFHSISFAFDAKVCLLFKLHCFICIFGCSFIGLDTNLIWIRTNTKKMQNWWKKLIMWFVAKFYVF